MHNRARTKGSGTDLTYLLFGVFREWIVAKSGAIEFAKSDQNTTAFEQDQTWIRAILRADSELRNEGAICLVDQLLETTV